MSQKREFSKVCKIEHVTMSPEVGRMVDSSQADDRKMIRLVKDRKLLFARNNMPVASYYAQVKQLWQEVAHEMGWSVADVRRKWSHIRNSYSRHLRNEMHGARTGKGRMVSRWYLADELEFLREHMATDTSAPFPTYAPTFLEMDMTESQSSTCIDTVDVKPFLHGPWFTLGSPSSVASQLFEPKQESPVPPPLLVNEDSSSSQAFGPDENSCYFQFFRSIHNDYLELSPRKRRQFKRQCLFYLHNLLDEEDDRLMTSNLYQNDAINLSNTVTADQDPTVVAIAPNLCVVEKIEHYSILPTSD